MEGLKGERVRLPTGEKIVIPPGLSLRRKPDGKYFLIRESKSTMRRAKRQEMEELGIKSKKTYRRMKIKVKRLLKENTLHLCNDCLYDIPTCKAERGKIVYGAGKGNDNIIECKTYRKKEG